MEKQEKIIVVSEIFLEDINKFMITEMKFFGPLAADAFIAELYFKVEQLNFLYNLHPEIDF